MFKLDSPQVPCRADRQQLCEHCLSQYVQSRNHWSVTIKDRFYEVIEIFAIVGKIVFGIMFSLLVALSYLCPSMMRSSSEKEREDQDWRAKRDRDDEREKEEQMRFERDCDRVWKSKQFNELAHKSNSAGPGYASYNDHLENERLRDEIEKNRQFNDTDSMIELAHSLACRREEDAEALRRARQQALDDYKEAVAHEGYLIRELKKRPDDEELRRDRYEASKVADELHRRYQHLCLP